MTACDSVMDVIRDAGGRVVERCPGIWSAPQVDLMRNHLGQTVPRWWMSTKQLERLVSRRRLAPVFDAGQLVAAHVP